VISFLRFARYTAACLVLISGASLIQAQDTNAPTPPAPGETLYSTNSTTSIFFDGHSNGSSSKEPTLSLLPPAAPESETPEPSSTAPGTAPETFNLINPTDETENLADHLLVVYNQNDFNSKHLAEYYASQRNIPEERVLPISCATAEEITRAEFEKTIRQPILFYLLQKNWMTRGNSETHIGSRVIRLVVATHNDIWAIVLMRGVPLKVAPDPSDDDTMEHEPSLQSNAASVDSELALLPVFGFPKGGFVPNVFFDAQGLRQHRVGSELAKNVILVSRLDGPTPGDVRRMIDDTLFAEKNRLAGLAVVDTRGITDVKNGYISGDVWLRNARKMLDQDGWLVKFDDKPDVLPATDPCNQVALYLGWYSDHAEGPWVTAPDRFVRGAIAYHLHSFSADTVRSETSNWVGPLIAHGAAATMGTVYEPYLALTPHEDIFTKRILAGDYFAEASYASIPGLSWMVTVVGDPLYRPFRVPLESALANVGTPHTDHDDWLLLQQMQRKIIAMRNDAKTVPLTESFNMSGMGPVGNEGLGDILDKLQDTHSGYSVDEAYKKALATYTLPIDQIRVGLKLAQYYSNHGQDSRAQAEIDTLRQTFPADSIRFGLSGPLVPTVIPQPPPVKPPPPSYERNTSDKVGLPIPPKPPLPPFPQPAPNEQ